jgi:tungstate transport system permease protein
MDYFSEAIAAAIHMILQFDSKVYEIVWTSLKISLIATFFSSLLGVGLEIWVGIFEFAGKRLLQLILSIWLCNHSKIMFENIDIL